MYFNKFQSRLEEIIKKRGTSYAFPSFLEESGRNRGTPCFFLAQKKLVTQYSFTNFFIAKRRDRVQERGTRTTFSKMKKSRLRQKEVHVPTRNGGHELFQRE
jgi:hypothetical protein